MKLHCDKCNQSYIENFTLTGGVKGDYKSWHISGLFNSGDTFEDIKRETELLTYSPA